MYDSVKRAATTATGLDAEQDRGIISKTQFTATLNEPSSIRTSSGSGPRRQKTMGDATAQTRVKKLEKKASKRTHKLNRLYKIGSSKRIKSSDEAGLGDQEDASKQKRIIDNFDADEGVTLVDETQARNDQDMFDTVTIAGVEVSAAATTPRISMDDITLAKALAALKSTKPIVKEPSIPVSAVSTTSTTVTTTTTAKGIVMQEPKETTIRTTIAKRKRGFKTKEEEANIALISKWNDVQAMMDADHELAKILQAEEQGELSIKESFKEVQKAFDNTMSWINSFVPMDKDVAEGNETRAKESSKRAEEELESDKSKKQKLNEKIEAEEDNDQEEAEMKMYMKIVSDDEIAINVIPLATKPPIIVDWKIIKEGKISSYHIIRQDKSSKRFSPMIQMLQNIDREDLETLWKLVKAKYGNTRPEEAYEKCYGVT
nr:hypothetical protein [Tanacetum cinerariifolium]